MGTGNAKKWRKGQSSVSNPATRKFRQAARGQFSLSADMRDQMADELSNKMRIGKGPAQKKAAKAQVVPLTAANLATHTHKTTAEHLDEDDEGAGGSTMLTLKDVLAKVQRFAKSPLEAHREAVAVLECVKEAIEAEGAEANETGYFAMLMTLLEKHKDNPESEGAMVAVCYLLSLFVPIVPISVQRARFSEASSVLMGTLTAHYEGSTSMVKALLECLVSLMYSQEPLMWQQAHTMKVYRTVLQCTLDHRPKIRHKACEGVARLLRTPPFPLQTHPAAAETAQVLRQRLFDSFSAGSKNADMSHVMHTLTLLVRVVSFLPTTSIKSVCEAILQVLTLGVAMASKLCMEALRSLFAAGSDTTISTELVAQLLNALFDYQPNINDADLYCAWMDVMAKGTILLDKLDGAVCGEHLPRVVEGLTNALKSDSDKTWAPAAKAVESILSTSLSSTHPRVAAALATGATGKTPAHRVISVLGKTLGYQYGRAYVHVLAVLRAAFASLGAASHPLMDAVLASAVNLYGVKEFNARPALFEMVGAAVESMGPRSFFEVVPLDLDLDSARGTFPRAWLLPVFADHIKYAELAYFDKAILPLANRMAAKAEELQAVGQEELAKVHHQLYLQLWALLPGFCTLPSDADVAFKGLARTLGVAIESQPLLRPTVCEALRVLITRLHALTVEEGAEMPAHLTAEKVQRSCAAIAGFAKNFYPILFNAYSQTSLKGQALAQEQRTQLMAAIRAFTLISDQGTINTFFKMVVRKLLELSTANANAPENAMGIHNMMDLTAAFVFRLDEGSLDLLYRVVKPQLVNPDPILQKQSYQVLSTIWGSDNAVHQAFATKHFSDLRASLGDTQLASGGAAKKNRLRLLILLVQNAHGQDLELIPAIVPDAILATKEVNEKTRNLAYKLLTEMGNAMLRAEAAGESWMTSDPNGQHENVVVRASLSELFTMVLAGLGGQSPHMISATVMALGCMLYAFHAKLPVEMVDNLLEAVTMLLASKSREVVKATLGFVKVSLVVDANVLRRHLPALVNSMLNWSEDSKNHFRMRVRVICERLIRKFGYEYMLSLTPEEHRKLLVNIHKQKERAQKKKRDGTGAGDAMDDDGRQDKAKGKGAVASFEDALYGSEDEGSDAEGPAERGAWLREDDEEDDDVLDFLDPSVVQKVVSSDPNRKKRQAAQWDKFNKEGKMVIEESGSEDEDEKIEEESEDEEDMRTKKGKKRGWKEGDNDGDWDGVERASKKRQAGKDGEDAGAAYRSKRANGDVKKKGTKFEPYAYIKLDKKFINKRNRNKSTTQFKGILKKNKRA